MRSKKNIKNAQINNYMNNLLNNLFFKIIFFSSVIIYTVILGISSMNKYKGDNKLFGLLNPEFIYLAFVIILISTADNKRRMKLIPILAILYFIVYYLL